MPAEEGIAITPTEHPFWTWARTGGKRGGAGNARPVAGAEYREAVEAAKKAGLPRIYEVTAD